MVDVFGYKLSKNGSPLVLGHNAYFAVKDVIWENRRQSDTEQAVANNRPPIWTP